MSKNSNTFILAAGGLLAVYLLSQSKEEKPAAPMPVKSNTKGKPTAFITQMAPYAREAQKVYPQVPIEVMLSFSGLESGWGRSAPQFNFFGTKPGSAWKGKTQVFDTTEILPKASGYKFPKVYSVTPIVVKGVTKYRWKVADAFRAFDNPKDAFLDFCKFITGGRYKEATKNKDIRSIITAIWKAGYATDPGYVDKQMKLIGIIQQVLKEAKV